MAEELGHGEEGVLDGVGDDRLGEVLDLREDSADVLRGERRREGSSLAANAADHRDPSGTDLKELSRDISVFVAEVEHERGDVLGLESIEKVLGHDGGGHTSSSNRGDGVDADVLVETLDGQAVGETEKGQFGRAVVGLTSVSVQTSC